MSFGQYSNQSYMPRSMREVPKSRETGTRVAGSFSTRQVIHVWAQRTQTYGQNGKGNVFFRGDKLFDYGEHFCLGQFVQNKSGEVACLLNLDSYSITTSRHQSVTRWAVPEGIQKFTIPGAGLHRGEQIPHDEVMQGYALRAKECSDKAQRARLARKREDNEELAAEIVLEASHYASFFGLKNPPGDLSALVAAAEKLQAKKKRALLKAEKQARLASIAQFEAWKAGTSGYCPGAWARDSEGGVRLRVAGQNLETALGAEVPLSHAIRAFKFIKAVKERGRAWNKNGHSVRVGLFTVDSIEANGNVRAGCHLLSWATIEETARALGVFNEAASEEALEPKAD